MISKETAEKLYDMCDEIDDCKKALDVFKENPEISHLSTYVSRDDDKSIDVFLSRAIAIEAMQKQLSFLEAEYKALNDKAIEEARDDGCSDI